jgi:hypothetical protein
LQSLVKLLHGAGANLMDKLDDRNVDSFGESVRRIVLSLPNTTSSNLGQLIENVYLRFQREAERDAREARNR